MLIKHQLLTTTLALTFYTFFAGTAHANEFYLSGIDLYKICSSSSEKDLVSCKSYLRGVLDGRVEYMVERADIDGNGKSHPIGICFPNDMYGRWLLLPPDGRKPTIDDLRIAVINEIDTDHAYFDNYAGGYAVVKAIKKVFPCPVSTMGPVIKQK